MARMQMVDHETYQRWLDLDLAGELDEAERARLERHVEDCAACRAERSSLGALDELLDAERVPVREGFRAEVMASLPAAGWEARQPVSWRWPLAACAALLGAAVALLALTGGVPADSFSGALGAVADLFATGALAGAGLLAASWKGIGLITVEALGAIPGGLIAFAVLVVCCNLLLFSLLRRRKTAAETAEGESRP